MDCYRVNYPSALQRAHKKTLAAVTNETAAYAILTSAATPRIRISWLMGSRKSALQGFLRSYRVQLGLTTSNSVTSSVKVCSPAGFWPCSLFPSRIFDSLDGCPETLTV